MIPAWRSAMQGGMGQPFGMLMPSQLPGMGGQGVGQQQMGGMLNPMSMPGMQQQMNRTQQPMMPMAMPPPPQSTQPPTPQPIPAIPAGGFGSSDAKMGWANQANSILAQNQAAQTAYQQQQQPAAAQPPKDPILDYWLNFNYGGSGV